MPLFGASVTVKKEAEVARLATILRGREDTIPAAIDSRAVARLQVVGAITVGKTDMLEFGQMPFVEGEWGAIHNPYNLTRSPGGSSGGSAVAVISGMVPLTPSGDTDGFIRTPAAWSGVFDIKPNRGWVSMTPYPNL